MLKKFPPFAGVPLIATITNKTLGLPLPKNPAIKIRRLAARIFVRDENGKIPILFTEEHGNHKIPGGGVENKESPVLAAERETLEEAGAIVKVDPVPIAKILEIKSDDGIEQLSLLFTGILINKNKGVNFTAAEISEGYKGAVWVDEAQALELLKNDRPKTYMGKFMRARDLKFLEYAIARSQR